MGEQYEIFQKWIKNKTLLSFDLLIRKLGRKTIFGRLIQVDKKEQLFLIYDVDKKQVLSIKMNEIDKIEPSQS